MSFGPQPVASARPTNAVVLRPCNGAPLPAHAGLPRTETGFAAYRKTQPGTGVPNRAVPHGPGFLAAQSKFRQHFAAQRKRIGAAVLRNPQLMRNHERIGTDG